jgi:hypothetical protein
VRRILALALLAVLGFWGGRALWRSFAADEDRIRWMLADAVTAFNAGRPKSTVAPLAEDWHDRTSGVHRDTLLNALIAMSFQERGRGASRTGWELALPENLLDIDVLDGDDAAARFELVLSRRRGEELEPTWRMAIDAELRRGGDGWEIWRSGYRTLEGNRP